MSNLIVIERGRKEWWDRETDVALFRRIELPPPLTHLKITLGEDPTLGLSRASVESVDVFINLHELPLEVFQPYPDKRQTLYWYAVDEMGHWTYEMFFSVFKTLDHHLDRGDSVYLHCQYGQNRSPIILMLYLKYRGMSFRQSEILKHPAMPSTMKYYLRQLLKGEHIPRGIFRFIRLMKKWPGSTLGQIKAYLGVERD